MKGPGGHLGLHSALAYRSTRRFSFRPICSAGPLLALFVPSFWRTPEPRAKRPGAARRSGGRLSPPCSGHAQECAPCASRAYPARQPAARYRFGDLGVWGVRPAGFGWLTYRSTLRPAFTPPALAPSALAQSSATWGFLIRSAGLVCLCLWPRRGRSGRRASARSACDDPGVSKSNLRASVGSPSFRCSGERRKNERDVARCGRTGRRIRRSRRGLRTSGTLSRSGGLPAVGTPHEARGAARRSGGRLGPPCSGRAPKCAPCASRAYPARRPALATVSATWELWDSTCGFRLACAWGRGRAIWDAGPPLVQVAATWGFVI